MYDTFYLFFIVLLKRDRDKNDSQAMDIMEHANLVHIMHRKMKTSHATLR